ncbi:nucleoside 2-deoxyribosyltransferase [Gracilibacillus phocaeensis]|uniref:nucleoside 2-deoxyribosyltransferase n=1 Tax=Gracilibacillus phocaeensis TaxID=2042304 RepID=UPI001031AC54|nr:nucleoside 2-deoxyribosyltransferase [Gracilibacillus phocaeensis]
MHFYIASSFKNRKKVKELANKLKQRGYTYTYDWTQNEKANSFERLSNIGEKEREGVMNADFFIILLPGGKGSHIELGIALGLGKRVFLYSPANDIYEYDKTCTFYHIKGLNRFVGAFDSFTDYLLEHEDLN